MNQKQSKVEIVVVGNELLNGTTLDTNSHWISKRLVELGALVTRKTTVRDELGEISDVFRSAIERSPEWIFSLGGLGPTYDDMTLKGLSRAIGSKIERSAEAIQMIRESRERRILAGAKIPRKLLASSLKMAEIPRGSVPLRNSVGTAPGVLVQVGSTRIVSFPGVPNEMKAIFEEQVVPLLRRELSVFKRSENWLSTSGISESAIAPHVNKLMSEYAPLVYIKSHPLGFRKGRSLLKFQLSATFSSREERRATRALSEATRKLSAISKKLGANVREAS